MAISVKAETHVMVLHKNRKFVTATPTSVTDTKNLNVLMIDDVLMMMIHIMLHGDLFS